MRSWPPSAPPLRPVPSDMWLRRSRVGYLSSSPPVRASISSSRRAVSWRADQGREVRYSSPGSCLIKATGGRCSRRWPRAGLADVFDYRREVDYAGKLQLLREATVFAAPGRFYEARGVAVMEAIRGGRAVVAPEHGGVPEILALTGGGLS